MSKRSRRVGRDEERRDEAADSAVRRSTDAEARSGDAPERRPIDPATIAHELSTADGATRLRTLETLQHEYGNRYVQDVVHGLSAGDSALAGGIGAQTAKRTVHFEVGRGTGTGTGAGGVGGVGIQREGPEPDPDESSGAEALDATTALPGATETIGPETPSTYTPTATTLAGLAAELEARDEAGHVDWALGLKLAAPEGLITSVSITADITLEMPAWTPPTTMLPKAKAEWKRAYAALLAHENGHIKLVHDMFDGLAAKLLGKTSAVGKAMFATAKAKLDTDSKAYDKKTAHGQNTGTVIDVSIEEKEIDEAAKKKSGGGAEKKDAGAPPS